MNMNEQTYHSIDAYLNGELHGRKLDEFKAELRTNEDLQESVTIQEKIITVINSERDKELKEYITEKTGKQAVNPAPIYRIWMLTAAVIALLISATVILTHYVNTTHKESPTAISLPQKGKTADSEGYEAAPPKEIEATVVDTQTLAKAKVPDVNQDTEPADENLLLETENEDKLTEPLDDPESNDLISSLIEKDNSIDTSKSNTPLVKNKPTDQAIVVLKSAEIEVRGDELLAFKSFIVKGIEADFSVDATRLNQNQVEIATRKKKDKDENASSEKEDIIIDYAPTSKEIQLEYWKSVVNYKGYQYSGSKVKLYGIDQNKILNFKELDSRLYLKLEGKQYYLDKNSKYNRLVEVINPTLLKVLND
jgi:hypothetical protein